MAYHVHFQQFGALAEKLAATFLQKKGFTILEHNYRYQKAEIDIIAKKNNLLVFVEVKARSGGDFGYPETFVHAIKENLFQEAAEHYMRQHTWHENILFDIIAILKQNGQMYINHFEDAF